MEFPKVVKVRQKFPRPRVEDVEAALREQLGREEIASTIRPGMSVAITAGSRGIAEIDEILRSLVAILKETGAEPFIVPAMGSHGGATAEGQVEILGVSGRHGGALRGADTLLDGGRRARGDGARGARLHGQDRLRGRRRGARQQDQSPHGLPLQR